MKEHRSSGEIAAEIAASLMWGPKPRAEIAEAVGVPLDKSSLLNKYLKQFRASGCIYVQGFTKLGREVFAWQPKPFEVPDAVKPAKQPKVKSPRANAVRVTVGGVEMSINDACAHLGLNRKQVEYRRAHKLPLTREPLRKCQQARA